MIKVLVGILIGVNIGILFAGLMIAAKDKNF